jgi:hypothetical protein
VSGGWSRASPRATARWMLALAGLPFFVLALSDPRTALTCRRSPTRRRIAFWMMPL